MPLGAVLDVPGPPAHGYKEDREPKLKPCAEVVLARTAAEAMPGKGLMPPLSYRNGDRARLAGFRGLAYPGANLRGRWAG